MKKKLLLFSAALMLLLSSGVAVYATIYNGGFKPWIQPVDIIDVVVWADPKPVACDAIYENTSNPNDIATKCTPCGLKIKGKVGLYPTQCIVYEKK